MQRVGELEAVAVAVLAWESGDGLRSTMIQAARDALATPTDRASVAEIDRAREGFAGDELAVDRDALASRCGPGGALWVSAWVYLPSTEEEEDATAEALAALCAVCEALCDDSATPADRLERIARAVGVELERPDERPPLRLVPELERDSLCGCDPKAGFKCIPHNRDAEADADTPDPREDR